MIEEIIMVVGIGLFTGYMLGMMSLLGVIAGFAILYIREDSKEFYENYDFLEHHTQNTSKDVKISCIIMVLSSIGLAIVYTNIAFLGLSVIGLLAFPLAVPALAQIYYHRMETLGISV